MQAELLVLRVVHVLGGIIWVGAMVFNAFFLGPALATLGPTAGQVGAALQRRRMFVVLPIAAILTILAGIRLMMITSGGFASGYFSSRPGMTYAIGATFALVAFILGMAVARPAMERMAKLGQSAASDAASRDSVAAEMRGLQARARTATIAVTHMLLVAAACMAIARYL